MVKIVEVTNLEKQYGEKENTFLALNKINLTVEKGEFISIMGPSGAGKSTLLNVLATIDQPTTGSVKIDGIDLNRLKEKELAKFRRHKLGFIFQDYNLLDTLTLRDNISLPLALANVDSQEIETRVEVLAKRFGIADILEKHPYQVSGGQKQRAATSRAIITQPSLLLADEPTGALDSKASTDLLTCLAELSEVDHGTVLMVTHDAFAASYSQRVVFINDGQEFTTITRGNSGRAAFFKEILAVLVQLGGEVSDVNIG